MNTADITAVRTADIPEEYLDIVETIGMEAFLELVGLCGGQNLYIPKRESIEREGRDRAIRARFDGGNYRALAAQFRLSERQVRKIVNGNRS
jgi:Mor family transcriptional regulator